MKEGLGLDHHEGRSWRGFHHHVCLVMLAFGCLALERDPEERNPARPRKKGYSPGDHFAGDPSGVATPPGTAVPARLPLLQGPVLRPSSYSNGVVLVE